MSTVCRGAKSSCQEDICKTGEPTSAQFGSGGGLQNVKTFARSMQEQCEREYFNAFLNSTPYSEHSYLHNQDKQSSNSAAQESTDLQRDSRTGEKRNITVVRLAGQGAHASACTITSRSIGRWISRVAS